MAVVHIRRLGESKPARLVTPGSARIGRTIETQGILPLTCSTPTDGEGREQPDRVRLAPNRLSVSTGLAVADDPMHPRHGRRGWFDAGSTLNALT